MVNAKTAIWVFLSPLSGLWWAFGKTYPLFLPRRVDGLRGDLGTITFDRPIKPGTWAVEGIEVTRTVSRS